MAVVYLLTPERDCWRNQKTYVGKSTDPIRRLAQHNGERGGGACHTRKFRPWLMACMVVGFVSEERALQFEWTWQNPYTADICRDVLCRNVKMAKNVITASGKHGSVRRKLVELCWILCCCGPAFGSELRVVMTNSAIVKELDLPELIDRLVSYKSSELDVLGLTEEDVRHLQSLLPVVDTGPFMTLPRGAMTTSDGSTMTIAGFGQKGHKRKRLVTGCNPTRPVCQTDCNNTKTKKKKKKKKEEKKNKKMRLVVKDCMTS